MQISTTITLPMVSISRDAEGDSRQPVPIGTGWHPHEGIDFSDFRQGALPAFFRFKNLQSPG